MENSEKRYWDLSSVVLLLAALWVAALRLWVTDWTEHLERVELLVLLGWLLGIAVGKSKFSSSAARWITFLYSIILIPWQLGLTIGDDLLWGDRLNIVFDRLSNTTRVFLSNSPVQDPILFITSMSLLYYLVALIGGYYLVRYRRPWMALGVVTLAVLLVEYYHPFQTRASLLTAMFLFFTLMLIGRLYYLGKRQDWEEKNVALDAETGFDLSRGTIAAGLILLVMAWNFPTMVKALTPGTEEQEWVTVSWQGLRNRLGNMVASLESAVATSPTDFGNSLNLGTGAELNDDIALIVTPKQLGGKEARFYWKGRSYDFYDKGSWGNTILNIRDVPANEKPFTYPDFSPRQQVEFSIRNVLAPSRTYYSPGAPISISREGKAQVQPITGDELDVVSIVASPIVNIGDEYQVQAYVTVPTIRQLRASPEIYPEWVKERYLQVPESIPPRIAELAREITAGADNPYDKVTAITNYLRQTITYNATISEVPENREPLDWFLFSYKEGYCEYYASAEVMMLRSIGIPARFVVGYAEGTPMEDAKYYVVRNKDTHAWPEVYFYGAGWIPFEPTVSQPEFALPEGVEAAASSAEDDGDGIDSGESVMRDRDLLEEGVPEDYSGLAAAPQPFPTLWVVLASTTFLVGMLFVARQRLLKAGRWKPVPVMVERAMRRRGIQSPYWLRQWATFAELSAIERIFAGVPWMLRLMGGQTNPTQTPAEQISQLSILLPEGAEAAGVMLEQYQRSIYSRAPGSAEEAKKASALLWRQVARSWLRKRFGVKIEVT